MKRTSLAIFFILFSLQIYADENQTNSRNLLDLSYFPNSGRIFIIPSFTFVSASSSIDLSDYKYADVEAGSLDTELTLGYGITDYLALSLSGAYYIKDSSTITFYDKTKTTEESEGFTDPALTVGYRAYERNFIFDLFVTYSPKMINARSATDNKNGNEGRGGSAFTMGLESGKFFNKNEINCGLGYSIINPREEKDAEDGTISEIHGGHEFAASLAFQHRIENFALTLGLDYLHTFRSNISDKSDNSELDIDPTNAYLISAGLTYAIIPQQLAISAVYGYSILLAYNVTSEEEYTAPVVFKNNDSELNLFNISAIFQY